MKRISILCTIVTLGALLVSLAACGGGTPTDGDIAGPDEEGAVIIEGGDEEPIDEEAAEELDFECTVTYFDDFVPEEDREEIEEKYCTLFENEMIVNAISSRYHGRFLEWDESLQRQLFDTIRRYELDDGATTIPFEGDCVLDGEGERCFTMRDIPKPFMSINEEYATYLALTQAAWHLFVEANDLTPWSITDYSAESLDILFESTFSQPGLTRQFFAFNADIIENYKIITGALREAGDSRTTLVGRNALETMLNVTQFLGERLTHFKGSSSNGMGPSWTIWPYRARNERGEPMYDEDGTRIPLDRLPTIKEILIDRNPHHNLTQDANATNREEYHIVNGCWGTSKVIKSLMSSINLPIEMRGDYFGFGGHSGARFAEIDGHEYHLNHSDDLYMDGWSYGLLKIREELETTELWENPEFAPFEEYATGYSVLFTDEEPLMGVDDIIASLGLTDDQLDMVHDELREPFGGFTDFAMRIIALRSISNTPSIQSLYAQCSEPRIDRRHLPLTSLTDLEVEDFKDSLDEIIEERRSDMGERLSCYELFFDDLDKIYFTKTGLHLDGDEDEDGIQNFEDGRVNAPDAAPSDTYFRNAISIRTRG